MFTNYLHAEEVLSTNNAIWIAGDGAHMAFASFDDTLVENFDYPMYGQPSALQDQYPKTIPIRYPKVRSQTSALVNLKLICVLCE